MRRFEPAWGRPGPGEMERHLAKGPALSSPAPVWMWSSTRCPRVGLVPFGDINKEDHVGVARLSTKDPFGQLPVSMTMLLSLVWGRKEKKTGPGHGNLQGLAGVPGTRSCKPGIRDRNTSSK